MKLCLRKEDWGAFESGILIPPFLVNLFPEKPAGLENDREAGRYVYFLAGGGVSSYPGFPSRDPEGSETREFHLFPSHKSLSHQVEKKVDYFRGFPS